MFKKFGYVLILIGAIFSHQAIADTVALTWTTGGSVGNSSQTRGWAFTTSYAIIVTALGWYDQNLDGLAASHQVGIWDSNGVLMMTSTVAAGTVDPLVGDFRYNNALTGNVILLPGAYVIGGLATGDVNIRSIPVANVSTAAVITYIEDRTNNTAGVFSDPTAAGGFSVGYFGPNFQFNLPEPSALLMLGIGVSGMLARHFAMKKRQRTIINV